MDKVTPIVTYTSPSTHSRDLSTSFLQSTLPISSCDEANPTINRKYKDSDAEVTTCTPNFRSGIESIASLLKSKRRDILDLGRTVAYKVQKKGGFRDRDDQLSSDWLEHEIMPDLVIPCKHKHHGGSNKPTVRLFQETTIYAKMAKQGKKWGKLDGCCLYISFFNFHPITIYPLSIQFTSYFTWPNNSFHFRT